jgi:hypothetical protein
VVELAHGERLLSQVVNGEASPSHNTLASEVDGVVDHLFDGAKGAPAEIAYFGQSRIEAFRIGTGEQRLVTEDGGVSRWLVKLHEECIMRGSLRAGPRFLVVPGSHEPQFLGLSFKLPYSIVERVGGPAANCGPSLLSMIGHVRGA